MIFKVPWKILHLEFSLVWPSVFKLCLCLWWWHVDSTSLFFFPDVCAAVPNVSAKWGLLRLRSDLTLIWLKRSVASDSLKSSALAVGVQGAPRSSFFLCLPLYPDPQPALQRGPLTHTALYAVCPVCGSLPDTLCLCIFNLAWASHFAQMSATAKRPSCLGRNSHSESWLAPSPPALLAAGMFSMFAGFEDIFSFHFGFPAPRNSCAYHTGGLTSREKGISNPLPCLVNTWLLCRYSCTFIWRFCWCVEMVDTRRQACVLLTFRLIMQCLRCFVSKGVSWEAVGCDGADIRTLPSCSLRTRSRDVGDANCWLCLWPQDCVVLGNTALVVALFATVTHPDPCQPVLWILAWSAVEGHHSQLVWFGVTGKSDLLLGYLFFCTSNPPNI